MGKQSSGEVGDDDEEEEWNKISEERLKDKHMKEDKERGTSQKSKM